MIPPDYRREAAETATLAGPVVLTQLGLVSLGLVDSLIVGPLGKVALGGVGIGSSTFFTVCLLALGTIMALDALVAQAFGAGDRARCGHLLWQGMWVAAGFALPLTVLFLDFEWAMLRLGQKPDVAATAGAYLAGRAWNVPTILLFGANRSFLNGIGNTRAVMAVVIAANIVNALAVYGLVHGVAGLPRLGVAGAGYGTSIAGLFMAGALAWMVHSGAHKEYDVTPRRPDLRAIAGILRFGLPIGLTILAEVAVFNAAFVVMGQIGPEALAAHNVAIQLASFTFMVPLGVSVAASIRVGQAIGRRAPQDVRRAGMVAYALGVGFMTLSAVAFIAIPERLARLFTQDAAVVALAVTLLRIAGLFQLSDGAQAVGAGCLRGAGDSRTAFIVNVIAHWGIGFPLGYGLAVLLGRGAPGMWLGLTASLTAVAVLLALRFRKLSRVAAAEPAQAGSAASIAR